MEQEQDWASLEVGSLQQRKSLVEFHSGCCWQLQGGERFVHHKLNRENA